VSAPRHTRTTRFWSFRQTQKKRYKGSCDLLPLRFSTEAFFYSLHFRPGSILLIRCRVKSARALLDARGVVSAADVSLKVPSIHLRGGCRSWFYERADGQCCYSQLELEFIG